MTGILLVKVVCWYKSCKSHMGHVHSITNYYVLRQFSVIKRVLEKVPPGQDSSSSVEGAGTMVESLERVWVPIFKFDRPKFLLLFGSFFLYRSDVF